MLFAFYNYAKVFFTIRKDLPSGRDASSREEPAPEQDKEP